MARLIDFIPAITAEVPDSDAVVFAPLRKALREFCKSTACWQVTGIDGVISNVTQANPGVFTSTKHNLRTGELISLSDFSGGMTELNGVIATVNRLTTDTYSINVVTDGVASGTALDTTLYSAYSSGGASKTEGINIVSGTSRYKIYTPLETIPVRIMRALYETQLLTPLNEKEMDRNNLFYAETPFQVPQSGQWELQEGIPVGFLLETNNTFRTYPIPNVSKLGGLTSTVAVMPSPTGTYIADDVYETYHDAIVMGAVAVLKNQKGKDWFDREGSILARDHFESEMAKTRNRIIRGNNSMSLYMNGAGGAK